MGRKSRDQPFFIHPCGSSVGRTARCNIIKDYSAVLENLRVCWQGEEKGQNCGKCEKCIRTRLNFMTLAVKHLPCMPPSMPLDALMNEELWDRERCFYYQDILEVNSVTQQLPESLVTAIRVKLEKSRQALKHERRRRNVFSRLCRSFWK